MACTVRRESWRLPSISRMAGRTKTSKATSAATRSPGVQMTGGSSRPSRPEPRAGPGGHGPAGDADDGDVAGPQRAEAGGGPGVLRPRRKPHEPERGARLLHHVDPAAGEGAGDQDEVAAQQLALQHLGQPALVRREDA